MISITGSQRDLLLDPIGSNIWSGQVVQSLNSEAITWSLAKELYGPSGPYFIIPMGIFIGFAITFVHWLINKVKAREYLFHVLHGPDRLLHRSVGFTSVLSRLTKSCYPLSGSILLPL
jgi:hypothetical protein